jgi:hypothetical protein
MPCPPRSDCNRHGKLDRPRPACLATILIWFFATGLVAWLDNRARHTFVRSLALAGMAAIGGIVTIAVSMHWATLAGSMPRWPGRSWSGPGTKSAF